MNINNNNPKSDKNKNITHTSKLGAKCFIINHYRKIFLSFFIIVIFFTTISQIKITYNHNLTTDLNSEVQSEKNSDYVYIPIVETSDIHGRFFPKNNKLIINNKRINYTTGGLEYASRYINILREEYGKNKVLYLDSGDYFHGDLESYLSNGEIITDYFNKIGLNATTFGNHEYLYTQDWIKEKIKKSKFQTLVNNFYDKKTNKKSGFLGKNQENSHIYKIILKNGDIIKIGVIGLSCDVENDKKVLGIMRYRKYWENLKFTPQIEGLELEAKKLRKKGANAIILITHSGIIHDKKQNVYFNVYNNSFEINNACNNIESSFLCKFIYKLKPGIIDAIIAGDTHNIIHHWINKIPVVCTNNGWKYINVLYFPFKKNENGKYKLINDKITIEGPLPNCEKIFKNYKHCESIKYEEYEKAGELINFKWHNKKMTKDKSIQSINKKYYNNYIKYNENKIVNFIGFNHKIKVDKSGDSILGNLLLDAIKNIAKADFSIVNQNLFRTLKPGKKSFADFFRLVDSEVRICTTKVTGEELIKIINAVQNGNGAYHPTSGLKQIIKMENNEKKIDVKIYKNGKLIDIDKKKIYIMASHNFILTNISGGDFTQKNSLEIIQEKVDKNLIICSKKSMHKELGKYFSDRKVVDVRDYVDKTKPRITILN